jgi:hypothetical protein
MPISKFTTNLYASEVYRELERNAVRKGFFNPSDDQRVKLASGQVEIEKKVNTTVDTSVSGDLTQDVAKLAYALRRKGFISQAEEIETNLIEYKIAEKELYNLNIEKCKNQYDKDVPTEDGELGVIETQESMAKKILEVVNKEPKGTTKQASGLYGVTQDTTKAIIDFAHRDGDVDVVGWGELGTFETIQSIADKILAVTKKLPKGADKGESDGFLAVDKVASLIKEGQENKYEFYIDNIKINLNSIVKTINVLNTPNISFSNVVNENGSGTFLHGMPGLSSLFIQLGGDYKSVDSYGRMYKNAFGKNVPNNTSEYAPLIKQNIVSNPANAFSYISSIGTSVKSNELPLPTRFTMEGTRNALKEFSDKAGEVALKIASEIAGKHKAALDACRFVNDQLAKHKTGAAVVGAEIERLAGSNVNTADSYSSYLYAQTVLNRLGTLEKEVWWTIRILSGFGLYKDSINIGMISQTANGLKVAIEKEDPAIAQKINQSVQILAKLNSAKTKLESKNGEVYQQAITIINSLISAISNNDQKTLDELGYTDRSLIIPDIENLARKLG